MMAMLRTSARRGSTTDTPCRRPRVPSIRAGPPACERVRDPIADLRNHGSMVFAGVAGERRSDPYPHARPPRDGEEVAREEPPGIVDCDRDDGRVGCRLEQRSQAGRLEGPELTVSCTGSLREDQGRGAAGADAPSEFADGLHGARRVAAVDEDVAAVTQVVRDARDPAAQR